MIPITGRRESVRCVRRKSQPAARGRQGILCIHNSKSMGLFFLHIPKGFLEGVPLKHRNIRREILRVRRRRARQRCSFFLYTQERGRAVIRAARASVTQAFQAAVPQCLRPAASSRGGRRDALRNGRPEALRYQRPSFSSRIPVCQSGDAGATPAGRSIFGKVVEGFSPQQPGSPVRCRLFTGAPSRAEAHDCFHPHAPGTSLCSRESKSQPPPGNAMPRQRQIKPRSHSAQAKPTRRRRASFKGAFVQ